MIAGHFAVLTVGLLTLSVGAAAPPSLENARVTATGGFVDVASRLGVAHRNRPPELDHRLSHIAPLWANFVSGLAVADVNGDDYDDLLFVSSNPDVPSALFLNEGGHGFRDVIVASGLPNLSDTGNAATGGRFFDYDGDGDVDLLVLRFGQMLLFVNDGKGHFHDVTAPAGLSGRHRNLIAAVAFDGDHDGDLDLVVKGFFADDVDLFHLTSTRILPVHPTRADNGGRFTYYRNEGDGTFTDQTAASGLLDSGFTTALGHADLDNDGTQDLYVANDFGPDRVFHGKGDGTFQDVTAPAIRIDGKKGMNVDFGDVDNDGSLEVYVTNITEPFLRECNMLWSNDGRGTFVDISDQTGTCDTGWGWGAKFFDYANDSWLDLYVANGFVTAGPDDYAAVVARWNERLRQMDRPEVIDAALWPAIGNRSFAGAELNRLYRNLGDGTFRDVAHEVGVDSAADGRGVALIDFDRDGALDLVVSNSNAAAHLYHNEVAARGHWLTLRLVGRGKNPNAIGARVALSAGGVRQIREVDCGNGYSAQSTTNVHFGLGASTRVDEVDVRWPDGTRTRLSGLAADQFLRVEEPTPAVVAPPNPKPARHYDDGIDIGSD